MRCLRTAHCRRGNVRSSHPVAPPLFQSVFRLHCFFARDASLQVDKRIARILVYEDRSVVVSLLGQFALQLGNKTWSVGLQLVDGDDLPRSCSHFRGLFVVSLNPPRTLSQFPILTRGAEWLLASQQALGELT